MKRCAVGLLSFALLSFYSLSLCCAKSDGSFPGKGNYTAWVNANQFLKFGNESAAKGDLDRALEYYKHAIQTYEYDSIYYFNLGNAFSLKGQLSIAEESYRKAVELEPDYFQSWLNLGHTIARRGRPSEAVKALTRAASLSKNPEEKSEIEKNIAELKELPEEPPAYDPGETRKRKKKKRA